MKTRSPLVSAVFALALLGVPTPPLTAQTTITYTASNSAAIDTSAPNDPTTLTVTSSSSSFIQSGVISGTGGIVKTGAGTLLLTAVNTYAGSTTVTGGTLALSGSGQLPTSTAVTTSAFTFLSFGSSTSATLGSIAGAGTLQLNNTTLTVGGDNSSTTYSGLITGGGGHLTKVGTGTLILSGSTSYGQSTANSTTVSAGTLQIGAGGTNGRVASGIVNNSAVVFNRSDSYTHNGVISGSGTVTQAGTGTLTLSGTNTYAGGTALNSGTLQLGSDSAIGTGTLTINGGGIRAAGAARTVTNPTTLNSSFTLGRLTTLAGPITLTNNITITSANPDSSSYFTSTLSGAIGGNYSLTFAEGSNPIGAIQLSGNNTYTGVTTVQTGVLEFTTRQAIYHGDTSQWNATNLVVNSGATLGFLVDTGEFGASDLDTFRTVATASGGFKSGALLGIDTSSASGGTFTYSSNVTDTNSGANALGLSKLGSGTLVLSGTNTYTGDTLIKAGTLQPAAPAALPSGTHVNISSGATLALNVGGAGEFTTANLLSIANAGTFASGSVLGIDTSHAGGAVALPNGLSGNFTLTNLAAGTLTVPAGVTVSPGAISIPAGALTISGGTLSSGSSSVDAAATLSSGAWTDASAINVGTNSGSGTASFTLSGGALSAPNYNFGGSKPTTLLMSGGTWGNGVFTGTNVSATFSGGTIDASDSGSSYWFFYGGSTVNFTGVNATIGLDVAFNDTTAAIVSAGSLTTPTIVVESFDSAHPASLTVSGGTVSATDASYSLDVANGIVNVTGNGTLTLGSGNGTLQLHDYHGTATPTLNLGTGGAAGTLNAAVIDGLGSNPAIVNFNHIGTYTFAPVLADNLTVYELGPGTTTLTGANTYTGGTVINAGTLQLGSTAALPASGALTLGGGTLATGGLTPTSPLGTLTLNGNSTIDFGSGASSLVFANSSAASWTGTLSILNYTDGTDSLRFGTSSTGLTATQLSQISFGGLFAQIDANGFVSPMSAIPEPSTYAVILGVSVFSLVAWRRRLTRNAAPPRDRPGPPPASAR